MFPHKAEEQERDRYMAYRSSFLHSTCLVMLIALCLGAIGAAQAAPMRYDLTEKVTAHPVMESPFGKVPELPAPAQFSHFHADLPRPTGTCKEEIIAAYKNPVKPVQVLLPPVTKSSPKPGFTIPGRSGMPDRVEGRFPGNTTIKPLLVSGQGTVMYVDLEGGFYGIIADDGARYIPDTLPASCKVDGIRVKFTGMKDNGRAGIHMWGTSLRIISAMPLGQEVKADGHVRYIDLEGGFYGIVTSSGTSYLPLNLPEEYRVDGLEVSFTGRTAPDTATIQMWGTPVFILSISAKNGGDHGNSLIGSWTLTGMARGGVISPVIAGTTITAGFSKEGRVGGTSGCNLYSAPFEQAGTALHIGPAASTMMYCPDATRATMKQESNYLQFLEEAASWKIDGANLVIMDGSGQDILVFSPGIADAPARGNLSSSPGGPAVLQGMTAPHLVH